MGMFDTVTTTKISHKNFNQRHANMPFQTKCLELEMSEYSIVDNILFLDLEIVGGSFIVYDNPKRSHHNGEVSIYTDLTVDGKDYWIDYQLVFEDGILVDITSSNVADRNLPPTTNTSNPRKHLILDEFGYLLLASNKVSS